MPDPTSNNSNMNGESEDLWVPTFKHIRTLLKDWYAIIVARGAALMSQYNTNSLSYI